MEEINKYDRLLSDYKDFVEKKFIDWENDFQTSKMETSKKIYADEDNLYETVLWKLHVQECVSIIAGIEQALRVPLKVHDQVDANLDYIRIPSEECINVRTWIDFKEKYDTELKDFFPKLSSEAMEDMWFQTINLILCLCPKKYSISIDWKRLPRPQNPMSQKWLDNNRIDIGSINTNVIKLRILKHRFTIWLRKKPLFFSLF